MLEADEVHCSRGHGGSVDADREVRVRGEGIPLGAPQGRSPGKSLLHQIRSDRYDDASGHREAFGLQETRGHLQSRSRAPFQGLVGQPDVLAAQQVSQDQAHGLVPPLDAPEGEFGLAHRLEHDRLVGAGGEPCRPGVAVERVWAARPGQVDGQILRQRHLLLALEQHRSAPCQAKPLGPVQHDIRGDDVQDGRCCSLLI